MEGIQWKRYSEAVIEGVRKRVRVFVGDSIVRKTDRVLNKGDDVVVCLPEAKIDAITEKVENIMGSGKGGSDNLNILVKWSEKWQMLLNFGKCKCLHTGHGNLDVNYKMGDTVLGTTVKEKDLGVTISTDMKVSEQCGIAASKGNQILRLIRRNITYTVQGKKLIIPLYKAIVRPHLE